MWFFIVWGLLATAHGTLLALNFRGYADWCVRRFGGRGQVGPRYDLGAGQWRAGRGRPQVTVGLARALGAVFAVVGPIVVVVGIVALARS